MRSRRQFLGQSVAGAAAISFAGALPSYLLGASRSTSHQPGEKILVVLQLSGGNDGLNTVIPPQKRGPAVARLIPSGSGIIQPWCARTLLAKPPWRPTITPSADAQRL